MAAGLASKWSRAAKDFHSDEDSSQIGGQLGGKKGDLHTSFEGEGKVKKGKVVYGVVIRAAMQRGRCDGSEVKFDDNAVVLVDKQGQPIGTRVFWARPSRAKEEKACQDSYFGGAYCVECGSLWNPDAGVVV